MVPIGSAILLTSAVAIVQMGWLSVNLGENAGQRATEAVLDCGHNSNRGHNSGRGRPGSLCSQIKFYLLASVTSSIETPSEPLLSSSLPAESFTRKKSVPLTLGFNTACRPMAAG